MKERHYSIVSSSQDRDSEVSGLYESTAKWLRTRVGNICTHALTRTDARRKTCRPNMHRFVCLRIFGRCSLCSLSACCRILAVVRAQMHILNLAPTRTLRNEYITTRTLSSFCYTCAQYFELSAAALSPPQSSRCNPKRSSKAPSTHASNCPPTKATASEARLDRSGSGTCRTSPT